MIPEKVSAAFAVQAAACRTLGSPFMDQLCTLFATRPLPACTLRTRIYAWEGDISPAADSVPLRLCGGLHALALNGDPLGALYPPAATSDDELWDGVVQALTDNATFIDTWMNSPPQTNEVRRAAVLIAAGHWLTQRFALPLQITELGASGGLNLMWDRFALQIKGQNFGADDAALTLAPEWSGPLPPMTRPTVLHRQGVDLNPLNPGDPADALRLRAYLWPDQPDRLARTEAAIAVNNVTVDRADAIDWLGAHLDQPKGTVHMIYSTIAWQYFPASVQARGTAMIEKTGAKATAQTPLAWFRMETDGASPGAALTLRLWPDDVTIPMGRVDFHGRWVDWQAPTAQG